MRHTRWALVLVGMLSLVAWGDIVYMKDGRTHEGKVTREGDKVKVELTYPAGTVIMLDASDVSFVSTKPAATQRVTVVPEESVPSGPVERVFTAERATCAEAVALMYARNLAAMPESEMKSDFRRQFKGWQVAAKDRKRQISPGVWITPADFLDRRKTDLELLKEAGDLVRKGRKPSFAPPPPPPKETPKQKADRERIEDDRKQNETQGMRKLREAAQGAADPLIRNFLAGVAELDANSYIPAQKFFSMDVAEAPRVPMFLQGLGMSFMGQKRYMDALEAYMAMLRLDPDSRDTLMLVKEAMKRVPGTELTNPVFINAKRTVNSYEDVIVSSFGTPMNKTVNWVLPGGRTLSCADDSLPVPPCDRYMFRQGLGVALSENTLLVDSAVVKDANTIFVQIDANTCVPAILRKGFGYTGGKTPPPPLDLVQVNGYTFTPVAGKDAPKLAARQPVKLYGLSIYEEMGNLVRTTTPTVKAVDANGADVQLSDWLLAGEAAGPVLTADGQLAGFVAGKTDPFVDDGGPDRFYSMAELAPLIKAASQKGYFMGFSQLKRKVTPQAAAGTYFVIHAVVPEKFD